MDRTKGERTRDRIIATAAPLFNQRGYLGASLAQLMEATGLEKGGIYRHFASKDDLALAAFDYAISLQRDRIRDFTVGASTASDRLASLVRALASVADNPPLPGGCVLMNTAVECDDAEGEAYAELRKRTRRAMRTLVEYARRLYVGGVESGEFRASTDAKVEAEALVGAMEGALMLSRLYDDPRYARAAAERVIAGLATLEAG